jgi:hypothetical protein
VSLLLQVRAAFVIFAAVATGQIIAGDLVCIGTTTVMAREGATECRTGRVGDVVVPDHSPRAFVAVQSEGKTLLLGELPAGATTLKAEPSSDLAQVILVSAADRIRSACVLTFDSGSRRLSERTPKWSITLRADTVTRERRILIPPGSYTVQLSCDGFVPPLVAFEARLDKLPPQRVDLPLIPFPHVSGRVTASEPVLVAQLHDDKGRLLGETDADGRFEIALNPDAWPQSIAASAAGFGTVIAHLPSRPISVELRDMNLERAGQLSVAGSEENLREIESVEILTLTGKRHRKPYRKVSKETFRAGKFVVPDIPPGRYLVVLTGSGPLERFGETVEVLAGETAVVQADWSSETVEVRTFVGEDILGGAEVLIESVDNLWNATIVTSAKGVKKGTVWQPGEIVFMLQNDEVVGHSGTLELRGPRVDIRISSRTVEGIVVNSLTDEPLADVRLLLTDGRSGRGATSGADGAFRFVGVMPGRYRLAGGGERGLSHETVNVEVSDQDSARQVRLALRAQPELEIQLTNWRGAAMSNALVVEIAGNAILSMRETDDGGKLRLPRQSTLPRSIIVFAPDGTFHAQALPAEQMPRLAVTVPAASGAISITLESRDDRTPVAGVSLAMRYNGVLFPEGVMQLLAERTGIVLKSGPNGRIRMTRVPVGMYEFWPVRSRSDAQAVVSGQPGAAPIVLIAGVGENVAKLSFARVAEAETP